MKGPAPRAESHSAVVLEWLVRRGETLAVAESCTGGWLAKQLTDTPGSSAAFWGGVIAYHDAAKRRLLGVSRELLERQGAVSKEVAAAMARGVRRVAGSDWGLALTGIAGPGGATEAKPAGTVWIAVDGPRNVSELHRLAGDREAVRARAVSAALHLLEGLLRTVDD